MYHSTIACRPCLVHGIIIISSVVYTAKIFTSLLDVRPATPHNSFVQSLTLLHRFTQFYFQTYSYFAIPNILNTVLALHVYPLLLLVLACM